MKTKIGVPGRITCLPLRRWLNQSLSYDLHPGYMADHAMMLRRRELDAAFVSPLEYARESSEYRILPGFALSSRSGISLHFHEGLKQIGTMAANPADISEIVLARIVLAEEFEAAPPIVPLAGDDLPAMLRKADSALVTGDAQFLQSRDESHSLDIAEAWSEMVDLPYVHGILCAREGAVPPEAINELARHDWNNVSTRVASSDLPGGGDAGRADVYLRQYSFALTDEAEEGLMEFLRYAHYHGIIPDVPLLRLYPNGDEGDGEN
jgi:predicted solute-binding protein